MPAFVVDASITLSWCFADEATEYSRGVLALLERTHAIVPAVWPFEIANTLAIAEHRRRISQDGIRAFLETLRRLPIHVEQRPALWLWQALLPLAREHRITAYDAAYLELAKREQLRIATLDQDLKEISQSAGVGLVEV